MKRNAACCKYHDDLPNLCYHCMKCFQIRIFLWSVFSRVHLNTGKYGPGKNPYLKTFHTAYLEIFNLSRVVFKTQSKIHDKVFCKDS